MAGLVDKLHKMWNPPEDEYEDYYEDEQPEVESSSSRSSYSEPAAPLPILFPILLLGASLPAVTGW